MVICGLEPEISIEFDRTRFTVGELGYEMVVEIVPQLPALTVIVGL